MDALRRAKGPILDNTASVIAGVLCAVNLLFMFAMTVLIVMMCVNVIIAVFYQSALPISVGSSFGSVTLAGVAFPYLSATIATAADWTLWNVKFTLFRHGLKVLFGLEAPVHNGEKAEHIRRLLLYIVPLFIWILSGAIGIAGGSSVNTGTILFLVLSLLYILANSFFDFVYLHAHDVERSPYLFVLFGNKRGIFSAVALFLVFCTCITNSVSNKAAIQGGAGAIAVSFILIILYFCFHLGIYMNRTIGDKTFTARSKSTYLIAAIELGSLVISGICIAASFSGSDSVGIWLFFILVLITYGSLIWRDVHVDLNDMVAKEKKASSGTYGSEDETAIGNTDEAASPSAVPSQQQQHRKSDLNEKEILSRSSPKEGAADDQQDQDQTQQSLAKVDIENNNGENNDGAEEANRQNESSVSRCSDFFYDDEERRKQHNAATAGKTNNDNLDQNLISTDFSQNISASSYVPEKKEAAVGQRTTVKRISYVIGIFTCLLVFGASLIDTSGDNKAVTCPGIYPGTNVSTERFSICNLEFDGGLSISDYASLVVASYMKDEEFYQAMDVFFPGENVTVIGGSSIGAIEQVAQFVGVHFWSVRFPNRNISIVVVRGSARSIDWQQDIVIGSDVTTLKLGMGLLPVFFSDDLMATLVDVVGVIKFGIKSYATPVEMEVKRVKAMYPKDFHYVNGHSLGAWAANIVAAQTATKSVAFSPVGTGLQRKRFDFSTKVGNEVITSVIPAVDIVPKVGKQLGNIQNIISVETCSPKNALCHSMGLTMKTLALSCGDPLGRRAIKVTEDIPEGCYQ